MEPVSSGSIWNLAKDLGPWHAENELADSFHRDGHGLSRLSLGVSGMLGLTRTNALYLFRTDKEESDKDGLFRVK